MRIEIDPGDEVLRRYSNQLGALGPRAKVALGRALAHTGDKARTQVIRALTRQIGLPRKTIVNALKIKRPAQGNSLGEHANLVYSITARGGDISLKYFRPREIGDGVRAKIKGEFARFPGGFLKVGWGRTRLDDQGRQVAGRRDTNRFGGHAMKRKSAARLPIKRVRSGVFIPKELVDGASAQAFNTVIRTSLVTRVEHEIDRLLPR